MAKLPIEITGNNRDFVAKLNEAKQKIKQTFQGASIGGMGTFLSASVWGAVATVVYKITQSIGAMISEFHELRSEARAFGTSTGEMVKLSDMATYSGSKLSDLLAVLGKLRDLQVQAALGSTQAATALAALGLSAETISKMSPAEQLVAVSKALEAIADPAQRAAVSLAIFGKMPEEIKAFAEAYDQINKIVDSKKIDETSQAWDTLSGKIKEVTRSLIDFSKIAAIINYLNGKEWNDKMVELFGGKENLEKYEQAMREGGVPGFEGEGEAGKAGKAGKATPDQDAAGKAGKATPNQAAAVEQVAKGFAGVPLIAQQHLPVDEFRRIGGFEDSMRLDAIAPAEKHAEEQIQVSKEILDHVMKVYEAMKSMDEKTPAPGGKF